MIEYKYEFSGNKEKMNVLRVNVFSVMRLVVGFSVLFNLLVASNVFANTCYTDVRLTVPLGSFVSNSNGTVTDSRTGLMWAVCSEGQAWAEGTCSGAGTFHSWSEALALPLQRNAEEFLNYSDWRLPNRSELASILELSCVNPAIDLSVFPNTLNSSFWTSTPSISPSEAFRVVFNYGNLTLGQRSSSLAVRLVRN